MQDPESPDGENLSPLDLAYASPVGLAVYHTQGQYQPAEHLLLLQEYLMDVALGNIKRLIITMPPQHGKTMLTSRYYPAWLLGNYPDTPAILASYEQDFATEHGGFARNVLEEVGPEVFGVTIRQDSAAKSRWEIAGHTGGMRSAGAGGAIMGKPAWLFLIDDPYKSAEDGRNPEVQEKVREFYRSTVYTRLRPDGAVILIQTRWDENDLAGTLLADSESGEGDFFHHLNLPAIAEHEGDPLGRSVGEPLWPEGGYTKEVYERIERVQRLYNWASLYQQRPMPLEGGLFKRKWLRRYRVVRLGSEVYLELDRTKGDGTPSSERVPLRSCTRFITADVATSEKESADYTVIAVWYLTPTKDLCLMAIIRERVEGPDQLTLLHDAYKRYRPAFLGLESVAYQITAVQTLVRRGLPMRELHPGSRDKRSRAMTPSARMESGNILLPEETDENREWLAAYEAEIFRFRGIGKKETDDQVDVTSYAAEIAAEEEMATVGVPVVVGQKGSHFRGAV